jgi:hypothetical protein
MAEEPMDMRIRKVLPELEEAVRSTREVILARVDLRSASTGLVLRDEFAHMNDSLNALCASIPELLVTVPRGLVNPDALNAYLANNLTAIPPSHPAHSPSTPAAVMASPNLSSSAETSVIPLTAGGWPVQPYDSNVATVSDAWREWHIGLGAGAAKRDSILILEAKFGSAWRYKQRLKQWHSRRKKVIRMIEQRVGQGHVLEDIFAQLNATGKSLDRIRKDVERNSAYLCKILVLAMGILLPPIHRRWTLEAVGGNGCRHLDV